MKKAASEEKSGESYPVETKHGSAPRDDDARPTVWDNDAVQLCGQALLMAELKLRRVERVPQAALLVIHGGNAAGELKLLGGCHGLQ